MTESCGQMRSGPNEEMSTGPDETAGSQFLSFLIRLILFSTAKTV